MPTPKDTSVLWFSCRATKDMVSSEDAVLVTDQGLRLPLGRGGEETARSEHLVTWRLSTLLTNRGKYRLILPKSNQTLVTFEYQ
jgi:hypothetical protein